MTTHKSTITLFKVISAFSIKLNQYLHINISYLHWFFYLHMRIVLEIINNSFFLEIIDVTDFLIFQLFSYLFTVSWRKCVDAVYSTCLSSVHPSDVGGGVVCPTSIHKVVVSTENWYHKSICYVLYIEVQWNLSILDTFGSKSLPSKEVSSF